MSLLEYGVVPLVTSSDKFEHFGGGQITVGTNLSEIWEFLSGQQ